MAICCDFSKITAKNEKQTEEVKLSLFEDYLIVYFVWMESIEKLLDLISKKLKALTLGGKKSKVVFIHRQHTHLYRKSDVTYKKVTETNE